MTGAREGAGLLGDTAGRDYSRKLQLFNNFAQRELRRAIDELALTPGMRVLDVGCGTGESVVWFRDAVGPKGMVVGMDLAAAHAVAARAKAPADALILQADLLRAPLMPGSFDLAWCINTINHLRDPLTGVASLMRLLRRGGRVVLGQSTLLPDMYFAWDSRLERVVNEAVRQYYRDRYGLDERELTGVRALVGLLRRAGLSNVVARTLMIERVSPLDESDERYLLEAIFRGTWGSRLEPYLAAEDFAQLTRLCNPADMEFAPRRPDFHFLQTFTMVTGELAG